MPSRNRAREAAKASVATSASDREGDRRRKTRTKKRKPKRKAKNDNVAGRDPSATDDAETRFVQPHEATKTYVCPGCNRDIPPGLGHLVAVPPDDPDLRRHWHRGCWQHRHTRF